jgi:hypothetical protein
LAVDPMVKTNRLTCGGSFSFSRQREAPSASVAFEDAVENAMSMASSIPL